jgi:hypothetical protein
MKKDIGEEKEPKEHGGHGSCQIARSPPVLRERCLEYFTRLRATYNDSSDNIDQYVKSRYS